MLRILRTMSALVLTAGLLLMTRLPVSGSYVVDVAPAMVLTGLWRGVANGRDGLVRMHYTREAGGAVRQRGEVSTDDGRSWAPSFDLTYRPAAAR